MSLCHIMLCSLRLYIHFSFSQTWHTIQLEVDEQKNVCLCFDNLNCFYAISYCALYYTDYKHAILHPTASIYTKRPTTHNKYAANEMQSQLICDAQQQ